MTAFVLHKGKPVSYPQPHDPDSTIWYTMIWDDALAAHAATITGGSWSVSPAPSTPPEVGDMEIEGSVINGQATIDGVVYAQTCAVKLSGGTAGARYTITCTVTTSNGETIQKSFILNCGQQ